MPATARPRRTPAGRTPGPRRGAAMPRRVPTGGRRQPTREGGIGRVIQQRRRPAKRASGLGGALSALRGVLPRGGSSSSRSSGRGRKGAGIALMTAAAGLAVSNRDKLGSLLHRQDASSSPAAPESTGAPVITDPGPGMSPTDSAGPTSPEHADPAGPPMPPEA
jgi:hypothetical protein